MLLPSLGLGRWSLDGYDTFLNIFFFLTNIMAMDLFWHLALRCEEKGVDNNTIDN